MIEQRVRDNMASELAIHGIPNPRMAWESGGGSWCSGQSDLGNNSTNEMAAHHLFDGVSVHRIQPATAPNRILKVMIHQVCYPMTEKLLHQVFDPYGVVEDMEILDKGADVMVFVQYGSSLDATQALETLQSRCIYDGCCKLDIEYSLLGSPDMGVVHYLFDEMLGHQEVFSEGVLRIIVNHVLYLVTEDML